MSALQLRILHADGKVEDRPLAAGTYLVGREAGDITLNDPGVSGRHAQVEVVGEQAAIIDLGSTNGLFDAAGTRLPVRHLMQLGQPIRVGTSLLTLMPSASRTGTQVLPQFPADGLALRNEDTSPVERREFGAPPAIELRSQTSVATRAQGMRSNHELQSISGRVVAHDKQLETKVFGHGGGSSVQMGVGYMPTTVRTNPIQIGSATVVHDQLTLMDREGREHAIQLEGFNLNCREGQDVTVVWAVKQGTQTGPYVLVRNHSVRQDYFNENALKQIVTRNYLYMLLPIAMVFFFPLSLLLLVVPRLRHGVASGGKSGSIRAFKQSADALFARS